MQNFIILGLVFFVQATARADVLSLEDALAGAYRSNPELAASLSKSEAESAAIRSQYFLSNPRLGLMRENNMVGEGIAMDSWALTQEIMFPTKYFLMGSMQKAKAGAFEQAHLNKKLNIRAKVISVYFGLYSAHRIVSLFEAQKETLREIARIAETRYSTGGVSQQDQMKAHVEQAKVENEILMAKQEGDSMVAMLNALLNKDAASEISLPSDELTIPQLSASIETLIRSTDHSKMVKESEFMLKESDSAKALARWAYAPDFMVSYRKPFNDSMGAYAVTLDVSIPLWFFMKQTSEFSAASAKQMAAEKNLQATIREVNSEAKVLYSKARTNESLLKIYDTSLIPLATNTLNTSRAAYRAGRTSFIELLDSERALYETRIAYYRTLAQYVENVAQLEKMVGRSLSSLPMGGVNQ